MISLHRFGAGKLLEIAVASLCMSVLISLTPAMEALMSKPAPKVAASVSDDKTVWAKDEESPTIGVPANAGKQGYSHPSCVYCP
jgi:hypothetical protein